MVGGGDASCYSGNGKGYRGMEAKTASGRTCAFWKDLEDSHGVHGSANFCRNKDESKGQPWCVPVDDHSATEVCAVPECTREGPWAVNYKKNAEELKTTIASGPMNCDCADELYGSTTTTKNTRVTFLQKPCKC